MGPHPIIFFDGVCGLCNGFVDFVMRFDREHIFRFATLQGSTAEKLLPAELRDNIQSVVLFDNGKLLLKSKAATEVLKRLPGPIGVMGAIGARVPEGLGNRVYDLVAENRYKIFGRRDICRVPSAEERPLFLD